MTPDTELLNRYATQRDEAAFAELVRRHLDHVYSTTLRLVGGDTHLAEDVAQSVFTDLARKARSLRRHAALSGWLHTSARFAAAKVVRGEQRRRQREQAALTMPTTSATLDPQWEQLRPVLDQAIGELSDADRDALLLRYFEKKPFADIGAALGLSENAARMRVDRATDKLRERLAMRGITSTAAALGTALAQEAVGTAPAALGARIISHALASAGASSLATLTTGAKLAVAAAAVLVVAAVGVLLKPKPSPVTPTTASAPSLAGGDGNATAQAAPRSALSERQEVTPSDTPTPAPHGPELFFVDNKTGRPITNQVVWLKGWERGSPVMVEKQVPLDEVRCLAPFDPQYRPDYSILTHVEGYADVRLRWQTGQGGVIPESYTVRLVRPVLIHGRVVDAAGRPVAGATVGFNTENVSAEDMTVEDHCIDYLTPRTDASGSWQLNRLAPEMVQRLFGSASHPEYAQSESINVSHQPELAQKLLDGTLVFHLGEGITVRGSVVDRNQQPIPNAQVHVGMLESSSSRDTRTGADGSFQVAGCQPGKGIVSAEADGFAPAAQQLPFGTNLQPVVLALGPGKPLRMRVVDTTGAPIAGASLWLDSFPRENRSVPVPEVWFRCKTDSEGRAVWTNAPDQSLEFTALAPRHLRRDGIQLRPDDQEHVITLQPALLIKGTVRDAATGELIPRFRLRIGCPQKSADGSLKPWWTPGNRFCLTFTGGEFRYSLEEAVIGGTPNSGYVFRFEAEGHAPFVTRIYQPEEGEASLDVLLQPANDITAFAYLPDGSVVRNAQVGFMGPGSDARLVPGGFEGPLGLALASVRLVDANGRFTVPDDKSIELVVVACAAGYAEATPDALRKAGAVRLSPWARIEGVWLAGGQPVTNRVINLDGEKRPSSGSPLDLGAFGARTDADGHFVFSQVPPGPCSLWSWSTGSASEPSQAPEKLASLELQAGETRQLTLGDKAAPPSQ